MIRSLALGFCIGATVFAAGPPVLTDVQPRGAQIGKTLTLTFTGRNLSENTQIVTTLPAALTPLTPVKDQVPFLVELKPDATPGVYPVRIRTAGGISNILFVTLGEFPEIDEEESTPNAVEHSNDTTATAQILKSTPVVVNGRLVGADRDLYRIDAKAGERLVFEVEARRCGSAIDPSLTLLDANGAEVARNEDAPGAGVDARIDYTFTRAGHYFVQVHDARFSKQDQNFYRLKIGSFAYPESVFPLGGRRGETVDLEFAAKGVASPVRAKVKLPTEGDFTMVSMPGSPELPFRFALSDAPELRGPLSDPLPLPVVVNNRISQPGQIDRYKLHVTPGESLLFELQSRELETSLLDALITIFDAKGKKLASAGDVPPPIDVFSLQTGNRTSNDPYLNFKAPPDVSEITVTVEDIAQRGGPNFSYRMAVRRQAEDYQLTATPAYINVPRGGTILVSVNTDRRGYDGPIQASIEGLPKGWTAAGGYIPTESVDSTGARSFSRRGILTITAGPDAELPQSDLIVVGTAKMSDGSVLTRRAQGSGAIIDVSSGTGLPDPASSDRQKPFTAPWLGMAMPAALAEDPPAVIEVKAIGRTPMEQGDAYNFEWNIVSRDKSLAMPTSVSADPPGARDIRIINMKPASKGAPTGTFTITTTKETTPAKYDLAISANLMIDGQRRTIVSRAIPFEVLQGGTSENSPKSSADGR